VAVAATGQRFWGCNAYPKCRGTLNTDGDAPRAYDEDARDTDDGLPSDRQRQNDRRRW
jgi:ssDNA-binding Zn-finger/Zn-ribbon topoisomerase 1